MRITALLAGAALALMVAGAPGAMAGEARVSFVAPERFTDASLNGRRSVDADAPALRELAAHIGRLAQGGLPAGQTLEVEVTDVDLTGQIEPWRIDNPDLRVVTGATWPRIALRYRLREGDRVIRSGEERLSDQAFDMRPGRIQSGDRLFSEKAMLDDWFQTRFRAG
ncbi:DUF3016 domain-containing protein [Roseomonas indoligenes]|uniref:DUF3016 domain-containing protein n=1 Tax=Roseomonas indoligenes TaxID=2820811 RepID=A0A940S8X8_9PROT|nr:DUF3016 domain-containing protein [Pararoseomonas indoligenes]MBP0494562.1 DUF3016 domain-containing protein [Pararoseomonas indoligenes]